MAELSTFRLLKVSWQGSAAGIGQSLRVEEVTRSSLAREFVQLQGIFIKPNNRPKKFQDWIESQLNILHHLLTQLLPVSICMSTT